MKKIFLSLLIAPLLLMACATKKSLPTTTATASATTKQETPEAHAQQLAKQYIITDGHVDLPYRLKIMNFRLEKEFLKIPIQSDKGDFDYVRAKAGGLDAPFMSIYLPANLQQDKGRSKKLADSLINMVSSIAEEHPDKFVITHWPSDVKKAFTKGQVALPMGMENGSGLEDDLANVGYFKKRGISYITLTHSKDNLICDSSYDTTRTWQGLSPYGVEVVKEMNKKGIMVDISHVSDSTFYQVVRMTKVPVIASHSSCRKFTPDFERNMSDDMLLRLKENNGVIMINFGSTFIDQEVKEQRWQLGVKMNAFLEEKGLTRGDEEAEPLMEQFLKDNPGAFSDVRMVANHIDHVVKVAGINHVGFGSDFDGVGDSLPAGLKDVSQYPNLLAELLRRGYTDVDIEKICYGNLFRVWDEVEQVAKKNN